MRRMLQPLLLLIVLVLAGCSNEGAIEVEATATPEPPFRVGVVLPSAINDFAFSQSMFDDLIAILEERGRQRFQFDYLENMADVQEAEKSLRLYAEQGYDLVIAHGSQYGDVVRTLAVEFPEISFAHGTTVRTFVDEGISNVYAYEARAEQGGFVNGVIAAGLSESGIIGVVAPIETGDAKLYVDGFVAGAQSVDPTVDVRVEYIGSFSDVDLARETAQKHLDAGADVLSGTAQMVAGAIEVAEENTIPWLGTQSDQTPIAPAIVVANQIYNWRPVLEEIIARIEVGELGGEAYAINLENNGLVMDYNPNYDLPSPVRSRAEETVDAIERGVIEVPVEE